MVRKFLEEGNSLDGPANAKREQSDLMSASPFPELHYAW